MCRAAVRQQERNRCEPAQLFQLGTKKEKEKKNGNIKKEENNQSFFFAQLMCVLLCISAFKQFFFVVECRSWRICAGSIRSKMTSSVASAVSLRSALIWISPIPARLQSTTDGVADLNVG